MESSVDDIVERDWGEEEMEASLRAMERRRAGREMAVALVRVLAGLILLIGLLMAARSVVRRMDATFYDRLEAESPTAAKVAREAVQNDALACGCEKVLKKVIY